MEKRLHCLDEHATIVESGECTFEVGWPDGHRDDNPRAFVVVFAARHAQISKKPVRLSRPPSRASHIGNEPPASAARDTSWFPAMHEISEMRMQAGQAAPRASHKLPEPHRSDRGSII